MATTSINTGQRAHAVLAANTIDTVTLTNTQTDEVEIVNRTGTAEIYFTTDGTDPTIGGANTNVLPAAMCSIVVGVRRSASGAVVKLLSAGTPAYSVGTPS